METEVHPISADLDDKEVATLFERNDWISSSVIDENNKLIGRIIIDDVVVDVIREDARSKFTGNGWNCRGYICSSRKSCKK